MLTKKEISRYARHIVLPEIGTQGQEKLKRAKVLVVGAGGLGCPVLQYLTAAGVGRIGIIDDDKVEESNLHRQILFSVADCGKPKVKIAKKKLQALNPNVRFVTYCLRLSADNAIDIIKHYDLVIDGSDNFATRYLVNDACVILNKSIVFGSVFRFEGHVSVFNYKNGPTYRCLFPEPPHDSPNCAEIGVLGVLPGIVGTVMANEALKVILEIGETLSGKLLILNALTLQNQIISFKKNRQNMKINKLIDYESFCNAPLWETERIKSISAAELRKMLKSKVNFQLIDVREKPEYLESNINGENIPLSYIEENIHRISKDKKVVIHCKSGVRSREAIVLLQKKYGFTNLYNLAGGMDAYKESKTTYQRTTQK